jgi:hypothetical protein
MRLALSTVLIVFACGALADIEAGNWEMTIATTVEGMPGGLAPVTQARCITQEDARDPTRLLGTGGGCEFSNRRDTGSEITFNVACTGQVPMSGSGAVRYSAQSVDGTLDLTANMGDQRLVTRSRLSGKRLGPCKP